MLLYHSSKSLPSRYLANANVEIKLCKAQAMPISIYQSLPVGMPNIAQNPNTKIPKISIATTLSAGVGPFRMRQRQNTAQKKSIEKLCFKSVDCHSNTEGSG